MVLKLKYILRLEMVDADVSLSSDYVVSGWDVTGSVARVRWPHVIGKVKDSIAVVVVEISSMI